MTREYILVTNTRNTRAYTTIQPLRPSAKRIMVTSEGEIATARFHILLRREKTVLEHEVSFSRSIGLGLALIFNISATPCHGSWENEHSRAYSPFVYAVCREGIVTR
jgi:hypothetical protein